MLSSAFQSFRWNQCALLMLTLAMTSCKEAPLEVDKRPLESRGTLSGGEADLGDAKPIADRLEGEGIVLDLPQPVLSIALRNGANIIEWENVEEGARYDLFFAPVSSATLDDAQRIEGIKSPYTHVKPDSENYIYSLVAFSQTPGRASGPSELVTDLPSGYLVDCLAYTGAARQTIDAAIQAASKSDCYILSEEIDEVTSLNLSEKGLTDLTPLKDFSMLESLNLARNEIVALDGLGELLNLTSLNLNGNAALQDLAPLSDLILLERLTFVNTDVSDLSFLEKLVEINNLSLTNTAVTDLTRVGALKKLESLNIDGLQVLKEEAVCPTVSVFATLGNYCLDGATISYANQIEKMMDLHCVGCHNVNVAARVNLDSEAAVVAAANPSNARIQNGTMPPGGALNELDMQIFASWQASLPPPVAPIAE